MACAVARERVAVERGVVAQHELGVRELTEVGCGRANTRDSAIAGKAASTSSTSSGKNLRPATTMVDFERPCRVSAPWTSTLPTSPVMNQSFASTEARGVHGA